MDNKLSELSKPVGYFLEWQDEETGEREWCECSKENGAPLYSQEYVSALQRESAVNWEAATSLVAENEELKRALEAKDKEIDAANARVDVMCAKAMNLTERAESAEKQLATPVRLPNKNDDEFWFDGLFQLTRFDRAVERALRTAGFNVQGDE